MRDGAPPGKKGTYRMLYVSTCSEAFANAMTHVVIGLFLPSYIEAAFGSISTT